MPCNTHPRVPPNAACRLPAQTPDSSQATYQLRGSCCGTRRNSRHIASGHIAPQVRPTRVPEPRGQPAAWRLPWRCQTRLQRERRWRWRRVFFSFSFHELVQRVRGPFPSREMQQRDAAAEWSVSREEGGPRPGVASEGSRRKQFGCGDPWGNPRYPIYLRRRYYKTKQHTHTHTHAHTHTQVADETLDSRQDMRKLGVCV